MKFSCKRGRVCREKQEGKAGLSPVALAEGVAKDSNQLSPLDKLEMSPPHNFSRCNIGIRSRLVRLTKNPTLSLDFSNLTKNPPKTGGRQNTFTRLSLPDRIPTKKEQSLVGMIKF